MITPENFDLVKVHHTAYTLDPVVNHARQRFVVAPVEEGPHVIVVLKLDLPPYMDIGAIFAPPSWTKACSSYKLASIWCVDLTESSVYATTMDGNYIEGK